MLIGTIYYDQSELLNAISMLYLESKGFELDPTYGYGNFYKDFRGPRWISDLNPKIDNVKKADCRKLNFEKNSVKSIIFDPPFLCGGGKTGILNKKYGSHKNPPEYLKMVDDSLKEFSRILVVNGILVVKCMDQVYGRKNYFFHIDINYLAAARNFSPEDLLILISKNRIRQWNLKAQQHARKFHSYFWVFKRKGVP